MAEVTAYLLAPAGSMDIESGLRHLRTDGWSLTGKMYEFLFTDKHLVPLLGNQVPKAWERLAHTSDRRAVQGGILRNGIDVGIGTFTTYGVSSIALGWKPRVPPVRSEAIDDEFLLPLAESVGAWIVVLVGTDPLWLPGVFRFENGVMGLRPDPEERSEIRERPPERVFVHETKQQLVDSSMFRPTVDHGAWLACELAL